MDKYEITYLSEDAHGASGDFTRSERINRCAERQIEWVYDRLRAAGEDKLYPGFGLLAPKIARLVGEAIVTVYDATVESETASWTDVLNGMREDCQKQVKQAQKEA